MEELFELKNHIEQGRYDDALALIGEMEEMSRDDKINKIESYMEILLIHLIKQHAERRSTRSWEKSIRNSLEAIKRTNKRRKAGGYYLDAGELRSALDEVFQNALYNASFEAFEGVLTESELSGKVDEDEIKKEAWDSILKQMD